MCNLKLACAIVCDCRSFICSDPHVRSMQIRGNAILCYVAMWRHCLISSKRYDVSFRTCVDLANELVAGLCTVETAFSIALVPVYHRCSQHPPMCLFQAGRNRIHSGCQCSPSFSRACMPCFFAINGRVGHRVLASSAPACTS